jgi:hypothetical protein
LTSHLTDTGWSPAGADLAETGFKSYILHPARLIYKIRWRAITAVFAELVIRARGQEGWIQTANKAVSRSSARTVEEACESVHTNGGFRTLSGSRIVPED